MRHRKKEQNKPQSPTASWLVSCFASTLPFPHHPTPLSDSDSSADHRQCPALTAWNFFCFAQAPHVSGEVTGKAAAGELRWPSSEFRIRLPSLLALHRASDGFFVLGSAALVGAHHLLDRMHRGKNSKRAAVPLEGVTKICGPSATPSWLPASWKVQGQLRWPVWRWLHLLPNPLDTTHCKVPRLDAHSR